MSSRRSHFPLHQNIWISEWFLDLSLSQELRSVCTKSWITFSRRVVTAGSVFLVLGSIWASSKSFCNARERALRLSGWGQSSKRWVMVSFDCPHRRQVGEISLSWRFWFNGWLCLLLHTIVLMDSVLALNAEIWNSLSGNLPDEFLRRSARSGNLTCILSEWQAGCYHPRRGNFGRTACWFSLDIHPGTNEGNARGWEALWETFVHM